MYLHIHIEQCPWTAWVNMVKWYFLYYMTSTTVEKKKEGIQSENTENKSIREHLNLPNLPHWVLLK